MTDAADIRAVPLHLGLAATATWVPEFEWTPEALAAYDDRFRTDGAEGRLLMAFDTSPGEWPSWEQHPAGDEVVLLLSGRADMVQWVDGGEVVVPLRPFEAVVNPKGVWHTARVHEAGAYLTVTPGKGTRHCPLDRFPDAAAGDE